MELVFQVLAPDDAQEILRFEERKLESAVDDPTARMFASWTAKWRPESLEHYLRLGWSLVCRYKHSGETAGYFLGQPLLFFRGHTQTLWVEHLSCDNEATRGQLVEYAVRLARDKHLQRALFADAIEIGEELRKWKGVPVTDKIAEVPTTKT